MSTGVRPTEETYEALQRAYDFFNKELFRSALPQCLVTLQREKKSYGYFSADRFRLKRGKRTTDEIALNPVHFAERSEEETLSTLVHEMAHVWQQHFGKPGRGRYHNKEWAAKMKEVGLHPSSTGEPGGKETGDRVSHYILVGSPFRGAYRKLKKTSFQLRWADQGEEEVPKRPTRSKYTCAGCGLNAWAKPGVSLFCGECELELVDMTSGRIRPRLGVR